MVSRQERTSPKEKLRIRDSKNNFYSAFHEKVSRRDDPQPERDIIKGWSLLKNLATNEVNPIHQDRLPAVALIHPDPQTRQHETKHRPRLQEGY